MKLVGMSAVDPYTSRTIERWVLVVQKSYVLLA